MAQPKIATKYPISDTVAAARAAIWRFKDPYKSNIPAALLSKDHIERYVRAAGMLFPFYPEDDSASPLWERGRLKAASYEAWPRSFIRWNDEGKKIIDEIDRVEYAADGYELKENSITFMRIDTKIRLPYYIALRFNLSITHVHRGLLLGTGPLVDPGFDGELLIPLHNLTSAPYRIKRGVVWFEFTKISSPSSLPRDFEERKRHVDIETYFERASGNNPIQSSISGAITEFQNRSIQAESSAQNAERNSRLFLGVGFLAITAMVTATVVALHSYFAQIGSLAGSVQNTASTALERVSQATSNVEESRKDVRSLRDEIDSLKNQLRELSERLGQKNRPER